MSAPNATASEDASLDIILKRSQDQTWITLLPDELQLLVASFLPSQPLASRSKAYIVLSACCQRLRDIDPSSNQAAESNALAESIVRVFAPTVASKLGQTVEPDVLAALTFLAALFQTDWQAASAILLQDGMHDCLEDIPDLFSSSAPISLALAHLLGQAAGHKSCRAVVSNQTIKWLELKARQKEDNAVKAAAAVALVKLNKGGIADAAANPLSAASPPLSLAVAGGGGDDLVKLMKGLVLDSPTSSPTPSMQDAVEGLAYLSTDPKVKEALSSDEKFLSRLFTIIPRRKTLWSASDDMGTTPLYGIILIIVNICAYIPRLTEEETQLAKLRKLAKASGSSAPGSSNVGDLTEDNKLDNNEHVLARGRNLLKSGVMDALTSAVKVTESRAVRLAVGKVLLSLVEDNSSRGKILQSGGAKALTTVIQGILSSASSVAGPDRKIQPQLDIADLEPIQALAKLAITASPTQVFGPNAGALYDAIRPFTLMLTHTSATLLQQFEAIMALTNLSSASSESADKIAHADGLLNKVELLMLEDHTLVRRASVELICNLIAGSDQVFEKYGAENSESSKRKLQVLVALCDVEDLETRMAASGAVATITSSAVACQHLLALQRERGRVLSILGQLIDTSIVPPSDGESGVEDLDEAAERRLDEPEPGLVHRGVMCVRNFFVGIKDDAGGSKEISQGAQKIGLVQVLAKVFREHSSNRSSPVLRPAAEALKCMMENGVSITS